MKERERETEMYIGGNTKQKEKANSSCDKKKIRHMTVRLLFAVSHLRIQ
jgi:hypothetical protein